MTQTTHLDVGALRAQLSGPVLTPQDGEYDEARILWNGAISRRPAVIAQPRTAAEVSAAVLFARDNGLEIAVRGGAHSTPGLAGVDDGLVVDLRLMRDVTVDPESAGRASGVAPPSVTRTPPRWPTGWPRPAASSATPAWVGSPSAAAWAG